MTTRGRYATRPDVIWIDRQLLASGGRLDALCYLGSGVVLCGARVANAGKIYRSTDYGATWTLTATLSGRANVDVFTIATNGAGIAYALTKQGDIFKSTDNGVSWSFSVNVTSTSIPEVAGNLSYGICVTSAGTVLVADTQNTGGRIFRSTNGGASFSTIGALGSRGVYRLQIVGDGIICNTWGGQIYKSTDDGASWSLAATLAAVPVWAIEYLGDGVVLAGDHNGVLYRSTNNGSTWSTVGTLAGAADDFASLGSGRAVYCTFTDPKIVYYTDNWGLSWRPVGMPTGISGDNFDHKISLTDANGRPMVILSSALGVVMRLYANEIAN